MRVLYLSQFFPPEPCFKDVNFIRTLAGLDYEVEVLTGLPNYPSGRLHPGYSWRLFQSEVMDGIRVARVPLYPSHDRSGLRRSLNYLSFAASAAAIGPWVARRPDAIYAYHPPGTVVIPAIALKLRFGAPLVIEIQDLWPDSVGMSGMLRSRSALQALKALSMAEYAVADRLIVQSEGFRRVLIDRGVPAEKISVIYNWTMMERLFPEPGERRSHAGASDDVFRVVYVGNHGIAQDLQSVLAAARLCEKMMGSRRIVFEFYGDGVEASRLVALASELRLRNVTFHGRVPANSAAKIMVESDALLLHLKREQLFGVTIPSKLQAYFAAGRPIVAAVEGEAADLVRRAGAGVTCAPSDPSALANSLVDLAKLGRGELDRMGGAGRDFYARQMALDIGIRRIDEILKGLAIEK